MLDNYGMEELSMSEMETVNGGGMIYNVMQVIWGAAQTFVNSVFSLWDAFW